MIILIIIITIIIIIIITIIVIIKRMICNLIEKTEDVAYRSILELHSVISGFKSV